MTDRDRATLLDIHRVARHVIDFVADVPDEAAFLDDPKTQSAVLYQIAIIGDLIDGLEPLLPRP